MYLQRFSIYFHPSTSGSQPWPFRFTWICVCTANIQGRLLHWSMDAACVLEKTRGERKSCIFSWKLGEEKLRGEERLNYLSTYLHRLPLIFSKIFSLATLARLHFIFSPQLGDTEHNTAKTVKSVSLLKVGRKSVDFALFALHFWYMMSPNWSHKI